MSLAAALGSMKDVPQFFIWRLVWDDEKQKYDKTPCALDGSVYEIDAGDARNWHPFAVVDARVRELRADPRCADRTLMYAHGFRLTEGCGYWFFDLDDVVHSGVVDARAAELIALFPGALMEYSSSGRGLHVIGAGNPPRHRTRPPKEWGLKYEFYSQGRGIAFGINDIADGSADARHDEMMLWLVENYFPAREEVDTSVRGEWRGPSDDEELIRRILNSRLSAAAAFGGKASVQQLWAGEVEKDSHGDAALMAHLAFWTGCDKERMIRLMWRSGMVREKWTSHRTYLSITADNAIAGCDKVYQEPEKDIAKALDVYAAPGVVVQHSPGSPLIRSEDSEKVRDLLRAISACGTLEELHNTVIPLVHQSRLPRVFESQITGEFDRQQKLFGAKMKLHELRALLWPSTKHKASADEVPDWARKFCYVTGVDKFYDMTACDELSITGFQNSYGREMSVGESGKLNNPVEFALHHWKIPLVNRIGYHPREGEFFIWQGLNYVNSYSTNSIPTVAAPSSAGTAGIEAFKSLIYDMCGRRDAVYMQLLMWLAHCVQKPGLKIRWSPILKGVQGDGKSIITAVLRAAMGSRNVSATSNSTLTNSGGFTDWAVRGAVNVIEEIWLKGTERHRNYNGMKDLVSNDEVNINPKGKVSYDVFNITNHFALTNHVDALPLEPTDRRWFVIFTPWASLADMQRYSGLSPEAFQARFDAIDSGFRDYPGEFRGWLLSIPLDGFNRNGSAPVTEERGQMIATSRDDSETIAAQVIEEGAYGVSGTVLSSGCLTSVLKIRSVMEGFDVPKTMAINHLLTRLGFRQIEKVMKWDGKTHRVWARAGVPTDMDTLRAHLEVTRLQVGSSCNPT